MTGHGKVGHDGVDLGLPAGLQKCLDPVAELVELQPALTGLAAQGTDGPVAFGVTDAKLLGSAFAF